MVDESLLIERHYCVVGDDIGRSVLARQASDERIPSFTHPKMEEHP